MTNRLAVDTGAPGPVVSVVVNFCQPVPRPETLDVAWTAPPVLSMVTVSGPVKPAVARAQKATW
ncbi:hypothetical protein ACQEVZ_20000 [Dactylosporangium sp. CA-152071]|uniref:hypothetical protein n=1 Tax=Dactylosporangium sp. CA-152071 TaxID=3239933 RepID=UPI003D94FFF2